MTSKAAIEWVADFYQKQYAEMVRHQVLMLKIMESESAEILVDYSRDVWGRFDPARDPEGHHYCWDYGD